MRFFRSRSLSPASGNCEFSLRHERVKTLGKVLKQFETRIACTVQSMHEVASCLSFVSQSYHEVAQCVRNATPNGIALTSDNTPLRSRTAKDYGTSLQDAATLFSAEMKSIKEGEQYSAYNGMVRQTVLARLHEVLTKVARTRELGDDVVAALRKLGSSRKAVQKKEAKYIRKGRPLSESKRYERQVAQMQQHERIYQTKLHIFDNEYEALMQRQLYVAGHTIDDFMDVNAKYLAEMLKVLGCLAPHGAETIEQMVDSGHQLGERFGLAPEALLGHRLLTRSTALLHSNKKSSGEGGGSVTPGCFTAAKSSRGGSSHNFTCYYANRRYTAPSADRAPPTARALDQEFDGGEESRDGRHDTTGGTPRRQLLMAPTPLKAVAGPTTRGRWGESPASRTEPDPSFPSYESQPFPSRVRRSGTAATAVVVTAAVGEGVQASPSARASAEGHSPYPTYSASSRTPLPLPPSSASFAGRRSANTKPPIHGATPPYVDPTRQGLPRRTERTHSTEPFDESSVSGGRAYALHPTSWSERPLATAEVVERALRESKTRSTTAAAVTTAGLPSQRNSHREQGGRQRSPAGALQGACVASAPPDDGTLVNGTARLLRGAGQEPLRGGSGASGGRHQTEYAPGRPAPFNDVASAAFQIDAVVREEQHYTPRVTVTPATTCGGGQGQCPSFDGFNSEGGGGGVTGRSPYVSTSNGLDSPVPTPQRMVHSGRAWAESQLRPCSSSCSEKR